MYLIYSLVYSLAFLLMLPLFLLRQEKYAAGFRERLGNYPEFKHDGRPVIWLHCVSVGEANAARPLVDGLLSEFPNHRVIISTTTETGQQLAKKIYAANADAVFYFPFDWKFSVRKALDNFKPSVVLLMETEIWPRFMHEAKQAGAKVAIVNGRLSDRSHRRYSALGPFIKRVLAKLDIALMQGVADAKRIVSLGLEAAKAKVTGNLKFDITADPRDEEIAAELNTRFRFDDGRPVITAASTHEPEERWLLDTFCSLLGGESARKPRLVIAPRHPERFGEVARLLREFRDDEACEFKSYRVARRSEAPSDADAEADIVLLDSIGELRAMYRLTSIAFVGGSLIPHGGQSVLEPAAAGNAIITGPYTHNFESVINAFLENDAIVQTPEAPQDFQITERLYEVFTLLFEDGERRAELGQNAAALMKQASGDATGRTIQQLRRMITGTSE